MPATVPREFNADEPVHGSEFRGNLNVMRRAIIELQQAPRIDPMMGEADDEVKMYARVKAVAQDGIYAELEQLPYTPSSGINIPDPGVDPIFGAVVGYPSNRRANLVKVGDVVEVIVNPGSEPAAPDTDEYTREVITPSDPGPPPVAAVFGPPQYRIIISESMGHGREQFPATVISAPRVGTLFGDVTLTGRYVDCIRDHVGDQDGTAPPSPDGFFTVFVRGTGPIGPGSWIMVGDGYPGDAENNVPGAGNHAGGHVPLASGVDSDDKCVFTATAEDVIWVRGIATFQSVNRDSAAQEAFLAAKTVPTVLFPSDGMEITWKIKATGLDNADPEGVEYVQNDFPMGKFADDAQIPEEVDVLVALIPPAENEAFCTIHRVLFNYQYINDGMVDLADPASFKIQQDPAHPLDETKKVLVFKKRKVRVNGYCEVAEEFTSFPLPAGAVLIGDEGKYLADGLVDETVAGTLQGEGGDKWISAYKDASGKTRAFHLNSPEGDEDSKWESCKAEVTAATGDTGGNVEVTNKEIVPDLKGHEFSVEDGTPFTLAAGDHLKMTGAGAAATLNHAIPGTITNSYAMDATSVAGGASITFVTVPFDQFGHFINSSATTTNIDFIGDDWIDFALGGAGEIEVTHSAAQSDGALILAEPIVNIVSGTYGGEGSITTETTNPYIDSKGHVNVIESTSTSVVISAGNKTRIIGFGASATVEYVDPTAGTPTSAGNVFVGGSLLVSGTNIVFRPKVKPLMVTTNSYGQVTAVTLGSETDGTDITLAAGEC